MACESRSRHRDRPIRADCGPRPRTPSGEHPTPAKEESSHQKSETGHRRKEVFPLHVTDVEMHPDRAAVGGDSAPEKSVPQPGVSAAKPPQGSQQIENPRSHQHASERGPVMRHERDHSPVGRGQGGEIGAEVGEVGSDEDIPHANGTDHESGAEKSDTVEDEEQLPPLPAPPLPRLAPFGGWLDRSRRHFADNSLHEELEKDRRDESVEGIEVVESEKEKEGKEAGRRRTSTATCAQCSPRREPNHEKAR